MGKRVVAIVLSVLVLLVASSCGFAEDALDSADKTTQKPSDSADKSSDLNNDQSYESKDTSILVEHNEIKNVADIYYYDLTNYETDDYFIIEDNANREYYFLDCGSMKKIENVKRFEELITINGVNVPLHFDIIEFNNRKLVRDYSNFEKMDKSDISASVIKTYGDTQVWIETVDKSQFIPKIDVLLFDSETKKCERIFDGVLSEDFQIETVTFSDNEKYILLQKFSGGSTEGWFYLFDVEEKNIITLESLTDLTTIVTCKFINDGLLYITGSSTKEIKEERLDGYVYNITEDKLTQVYSNTDRVIFSNGLMTIKQKTEHYEIMCHTGDTYKLENINLEGLTFLSNSTGAKIAVLNLGQSTNGGLKITELGVIDINGRTFKIFQRKGVPNKELSIGWDVMDNIIITTENMLYQYVFK